MPCPNCGSPGKPITPIMSSCCGRTWPENMDPDPAPLPPQPAMPATVQAVKEYTGPPGTCPRCKGLERAISPLLVCCTHCNQTRNPWNEPAPDRQAEHRLRVEQISLGQQLRVKGLPRLEAIRIEARLAEVVEELGKCPA